METAGTIQAARQGNMEAFNQLVEEHQDEIYNLAYLFLCDEVKAERATQATFMEAYLKIKKVKHLSFRIWLMRILVAKCQAEIESLNTKYAPLNQHKTNQIIPPGFKKLSKDLRVITALINIHGLDYKQAAEVLDLPVAKIRIQQARALFEMLSSDRSLQDS